MKKTWIIIGIILLINVVTFILYVIDKRKASTGKWRIPEKALLLWSLFGPWGAYLVIKLIRHKTQKRKFTITVPLFMVLHIVLLTGLIYHNFK